ncbi:MAG: lipid-A-disaccharide synthase N-terminal domain-containing protein [Deltaproteobacteria bacterium]|nr:lipid-A-disaccharide synthase N-terminal domain-containing protein [Deltaproteobacteria bacterium]
MSIKNLDFWLVFGFLGQFFFFMRFFIQWIVSEIRKRSTIPYAFWVLSLMGGVTLLLYAVHREDPVFIVGQAGGLIIYIRNIMLVKREAKRPE